MIQFQNSVDVVSVPVAELFLLVDHFPQSISTIGSLEPNPNVEEERKKIMDGQYKCFEKMNRDVPYNKSGVGPPLTEIKAITTVSLLSALQQRWDKNNVGKSPERAGKVAVS